VVIDFGLADLDEVCEAKYCEDWTWLESGSSFRWNLGILSDPVFVVVHPSGKVPEWFPPPPITPSSRWSHQSKVLFCFCCTITGFLLFPKDIVLLVSVLAHYVKAYILGLSLI
jgi:hypothetical protein